MAKTRIAALARVSSPQQAERDKTSLLVQRQVITEICEDLGFVIVEWYEGVESATTGKRPILDRLLADAQTDKWDAVMVYDATRWSRNVKEAEEVAEHLTKCGKGFYVGKTLFDPNDPAQIFSKQVLTANAQYEVGQFKKRVLAGKFAKGANGGWPYSEVPYGREVKRSKAGEEWVVDEKKAAIIHRAYRLIDEKRLSQAKVAEMVGFASPQVLRKRLLAAGGVGRYEQKNPVTRKLVERTVPIPPILTELQIARLKRVWASNRSGVGKHEGWEDYLLRGKMRCGGCGSVMVGTFKNGHRKYVHVPSQWEGPKCVRSVHAEDAERATFYEIGDKLGDRKKLAIEVAASLGDVRAKTAEVETRIKALDREASDISAKIRAKSEKDVRGPAKKLLEEDINLLSDRLAHLQQELDDEHRQLQVIGASKADADRIAEHVEYLAGHTGQAVRWSRPNKLLALDRIFGEGSLRRQKDVGIYLFRDGRLNLHTAFPLTAIIGHVQPGALGRPRLPSPLRSKTVLMPTPTRTKSCTGRGCRRSP